MYHLHSHLKRGLICQRSKRLSEADFGHWGPERIDDLSALLKFLGVAINEELRQAWGAPGQDGDALEIKRAVDKIVAACHHMIEWEIEFQYTQFPPECEQIKMKMQGWTEGFIAEAERISEEIKKTLEYAVVGE